MSNLSEKIDVFVLTYNRADLLRTTLNSLLQQTLHNVSITVLDNASTDHTAEVVASFHSPHITFLPAKKNLGAIENLQRSQKLASKKYVMVFHDDDQLHPEYLEYALLYLESTPDAGLLIPNQKNIRAGETPATTKIIDYSCIQLSRTLFATTLYIRNKLSFAGTIYKTDSWKSLNIETLFAQFGKWGDRPIMIEALQNNSALILTGNFVYYGRHETQDTRITATQPPHTLWLNRERYFKNIMGTRLSTFSGWCFCVMNPRRLKSGYKRRIVKNLDFKTYLADAFKLGATNHKAWRFHFLTSKLIQNAFNAYAKIYLQRKNTLSPHQA